MVEVEFEKMGSDYWILRREVLVVIELELEIRGFGFIACDGRGFGSRLLTYY